MGSVDLPPAVTEATLRALLGAFNSHDLDRIMSFFVDDAVLEMPRGAHPFGARAEGREAVRALLATRFEGIPDVHHFDDRHFVCADRGVSEWQLTGTSRDGKAIRVWAVICSTFAMGRSRARTRTGRSSSSRRNDIRSSLQKAQSGGTPRQQWRNNAIPDSGANLSAR